MNSEEVSGARPSDQALVAEEWRAVEHFEGLYEVSSLGRIRSRHGGGCRILRGGSNPDGYPVVNFYRAGKRVSTQLHQVVCRAFHGPPTPLHYEVAHLDGSRTNARADNLKWVSRTENHSHKRAHGTHQIGDNAGHRKLTSDKVVSIRQAKATNTAAELAAHHGVSRHAIYDIWRNRRWRAVK